jgi:uncharacterized protein (DUF362 family)
MNEPLENKQHNEKQHGEKQTGEKQTGELQCDRRALLAGGAVTLAALAGYPLVRRAWLPTASVFVAAGQRYDGSLVATIRDGLQASGLDAAMVRGRRVLLKPNMVEPDRSMPHMTTHPAMVLAAAEVFRSWGAQVTVGEAPGHVRDTELALIESGIGDALDRDNLEFADLNYEQSVFVSNRGGTSSLDGFYFPRSIVEADLVVSMPKLKTHHWVGMTAAMKNLYGTLPGLKYGWPKNVLHHAGIPETVNDINASLPKTMAIVDGILCMEGDGPIVGTPKPMGLVLIGTNPPAVDATAARIMGLDPMKIRYLRLAGDRLGPLDEQRIEQRGEKWQTLVDPFEMIDYAHLQSLRADGVTKPGVPAKTAHRQRCCPRKRV